MDILTIASQKGLASTTTLTAHLAVEAERMGTGPVAIMGTGLQDSMAASRNQPASAILLLAAADVSGWPNP